MAASQCHMENEEKAIIVRPDEFVTAPLLSSYKGEERRETR